jgi:pimeloyl-ACP methyl ester carboxylesterase
LIDHLGSYIFHGPEAPSIDQHLVLGVSLGGHAAWQVLFNEPRVTAAVVIIGCPDYMRKFLISYFTTELHCRPNLLESSHICKVSPWKSTKLWSGLITNKHSSLSELRIEVIQIPLLTDFLSSALETIAPVGVRIRDAILGFNVL